MENRDRNVLLWLVLVTTVGGLREGGMVGTLNIGIRICRVRFSDDGAVAEGGIFEFWGGGGEGKNRGGG